MKRIICEGQSDKDFILKFIIHLKKEKKINEEEIGDNPEDLFLIAKNKSSILTYESDFYKKTKQFLKKVNKLLFILDCDFEKDDNKCGGCDKTINCLKILFKKLEEDGIDIEKDYFLFDNNLEKFILNSLDYNNSKCFEKFRECLSLKEVSKHQKVLVCVYKGLYPKKPYDFSNKVFRELEQKLIDFFTKD